MNGMDVGSGRTGKIPHLSPFDLGAALLYICRRGIKRSGLKLHMKKTGLITTTKALY